MQPERDDRMPVPPEHPHAPRDLQAELEELLWTLEICRRALPWDAHPAHVDRLQRIERLIRWSFKRY